MRRVFVVVAAFVATTLPAAASERCNQPYMPEVSVAPSATVQDMVTLRGDVVSFIAASDVYQTCLMKAQGGDSSFEPQAMRLISENQQEKVLLGKKFNDAVGAYNKAHPKELQAAAGK
ncbi:MAG: hypothetical protein HY243_14270 [Proteobacteria bacterium]|nr:hypothetical protein [Pseudomonadota bacterium]